MTPRRGRPALKIAEKDIRWAVEMSPTVGAAARELKCSRGYIYKVLGRETVKNLLHTGRIK